jgi:hypothetical protein
MSHREKLNLAYQILLKKYNEIIRKIILLKDRPVLKITFHNEIILYIRYNDYGEYSYSITYSPNPDDQMRFDNYDDIWNVKTKPHHWHSRGLQTVIESPMNGDPDNDVPLLIELIFKKL